MLLLCADEGEEEYRIRCTCVHLDCHAGIWDNYGHAFDGHYRRNVHTLGRLQQLRPRKSNSFACVFRRILLAADVDGVFLLTNCPHSENKGNTVFRQYCSNYIADWKSVTCNCMLWKKFHCILSDKQWPLKANLWTSSVFILNLE